MCQLFSKFSNYSFNWWQVKAFLSRITILWLSAYEQFQTVFIHVCPDHWLYPMTQECSQEWVTVRAKQPCLLTSACLILIGSLLTESLKKKFVPYLKKFTQNITKDFIHKHVTEVRSQWLGPFTLAIISVEALNSELNCPEPKELSEQS